jgi:hypothetical protein
MISFEIHGGRTTIAFLRVFSADHQSTIAPLIYHRPLRCAIAQITQHIITFSDPALAWLQSEEEKYFLDIVM